MNDKQNELTDEAKQKIDKGLARFIDDIKNFVLLKVLELLESTELAVETMKKPIIFEAHS